MGEASKVDRSSGTFAQVFGRSFNIFGVFDKPICLRGEPALYRGRCLVTRAV